MNPPYVSDVQPSYGHSSLTWHLHVGYRQGWHHLVGKFELFAPSVVHWQLSVSLSTMDWKAARLKYNHKVIGPCIQFITYALKTYLCYATPCSFFPLRSWEVSPIPSGCTCGCPFVWWCMTFGFFGKGTKSWSIGLAVCAYTTWNKNFTTWSTNSFLVVLMRTGEWSSIQHCSHCLTIKVLENPLAQLGKLTILFVRVAYTNIPTIQELDHRGRYSGVMWSGMFSRSLQDDDPRQ